MAALLALLAAVGWGSSDYAAGAASRRSSAVSVVILTHFAAFVALLCIAVDLGPMFGDVGDALQSPGSALGHRWSGPAFSASPKPSDVMWGVAAGLGGGLGAMLLFRGLGRGSMAVVAPITASGAASIPAVYGFVRGETVTLLAVLGIVLALVAIVLLSLAGEVDETESVDVDDDRVATAWRSTRDVAWDTWAESNPVEAANANAWLDAQLESAVAAVRSSARAGAASAAPPPASPPAAVVESEGEPSGVPLRTVRNSIVAVTVAALLAATVAAAGPVGALVAGDGLAAGDIASLALAVVIVGLASFAAGATRLLFQARSSRPPQLERRTDPPSFDGRAVRVERRIDPSSFRLSSMLRQPGVPEALLSGVGFGAFFVFISRAGEEAGHWPLVSARAISVVMFAVAALVTSTALLPERGSRRWVVLAGLLDAIAAVCFVLATRAGLLSVGAVLASLYPGVTVVLARFVGQERIRRRQLFGLALAAVAVSLLAI